ncbi:MAG: hypothetical protein KF809_06035 [Chloroflexi bacterium]|nr:hypothetical protein [Chloroflexota bacterium]
MTEPRPGILGEIATEAAQERVSFLNDAAEQLIRFLDSNRGRITEVGGMVLLDEDPDYLSIAPDLTFRSRTRMQDPETGEWRTETEIIESPSELIEIYNPSEIYAWFAEAAREQGGLPDQPTAADDLLDEAGISPEEAVGVGIGGDDPYIGAADDWAAQQDQDEAPPSDPAEAARRLYDLALTFQSRSQLSEARLVEQFEIASEPLSGVLGDLLILDDEDERVWFKSQGSFEAEVIPEPEGDEVADGQWKPLQGPEDLVQYYDPTDLFGNLAETLAEQFPNVDPDFGEEDEEA